MKNQKGTKVYNSPFLYPLMGISSNQSSSLSKPEGASVGFLP